MKVLHRLISAVVVTSTLYASFVRAEESSSTPYIDELKRDMPANPHPDLPRTQDSPDPFIQSQKKKIGEDPNALAPGETYIDRLKRTYPGGLSAPSEGGSFIEQEKAKLGKKPGDDDSAIAKLKEGRSELHARKEGEIHRAFGLSVGVSAVRDITADPSVQVRPFNDVYGKEYAPDIGVFYEFQPWHSESVGQIGIIGSLEASYQSGQGTFAVQLNNPVTNTPFPVESATTFKFFTIPATLGLDFRLNTMKYVRPFGEISPGVVGYIEGRTDSRTGSKGLSKCVAFRGGANILLDWIVPGASWDLYQDFGVKHYYLTVEYTKLTTFASEVQFNISAVNVGMTYEF